MSNTTPSCMSVPWARRFASTISDVHRTGAKTVAPRGRSCKCVALSAILGISGVGNGMAQEARILDGFEDPSTWRVVTSNQVSGRLRQVDGTQGKAMCLDYDFNGVSGYTGIQRDLPLEYPANYRFDFQLRGDSPNNDLQFKLVDASGDNVWWVNKPKYDFPHEWTPVRYKRRHIDKAWGPGADPVLHSSAKLEFTIYNNAGGKGSVCFDQLGFTPLPPDSDAPLAGTAAATASAAGSQPSFAIDGNPATAWRAGFSIETPPSLTLDLGRLREFGALALQWSEDGQASDYRIELSDDSAKWRVAREVVGGNGGTDFIALPESEARYLRLTPLRGPGTGFGLVEATVQPLAFAATPNAFVASVAANSSRGEFPRGFSGEQPYWTLIGLDGGRDQALIGEDGAVEVGKGGFSIEPFVVADGELVGWADVESRQSLQDDYLPLPSVEWTHPAVRLDTTAFVDGTPDNSQLFVRYRLSNPGQRAREYRLALAVRPFQVNPPSQFLNTVGGISRIESLAFAGGVARVDGKPRVFAAQRPDAAFASTFDGGMAVSKLRDKALPETRQVVDPTGLASGAFVYRVRLQPGETREYALRVPMTGRIACQGDACDAAAAQRRVAAMWRSKLDKVTLRVPAQGKALADTVRTATAHMLISRVGPRLQPGTRSYGRSWIRDGAMISEGLLRMGRAPVVREYVEFYAPYQFEDGKVPCCVDDRGSDPVPENDSHGELIYNIAEYYRYTGDRAFLRRMWPHVRGAFDYMEKLRLSERTEENRAKDPAFYGMMPVSISHEGYSAKPMHSYWDNFWALRGYKDAADIAQWLGEGAEAKRMAASRDQFHADLYSSLQAATQKHRIEYLPGAAELGDFDPTSTTIALAPGGEQDSLPRSVLDNTFGRYWNEFVQRRDGKREWKDYTPYEWRNVSAFVRLGWRGRAWEAVKFFFKDRAPQGWNQWAEVVSRTPRKPFFVGDLPHAWVASDFVRSALDMFAYSRESDDSIVLAAGVPADWLQGEGVAISGLRTPNGPLAYSLRREGGVLKLDVPSGLSLPEGGLVLPWPYAGEPGAAKVNGKAVEWRDRELRIDALPAAVEVAVR